MKSVYNYVIIDDNDIDRTVLRYYLKEYDFLEHVATFSSAQAGLSFFEKEEIDLLFLDIIMPDMNGIELQKKIRNRAKCVVVVSSSPEFAYEGFETDVFDYILKPISKECIANSLSKVKKQLDTIFKADLYEKEFKQGDLILKTGSDHIHVKPIDIVYLEAMKDYTRLLLLNNKPITIYGNLRKTMLSDGFADFVRIHRKYAIRISNIDVIKRDKVLLTTGQTLPLGESYKDMVMKLFESQ
ncbi:LytTR family DNA-binding domain-containing protein [Bacteroidales bacterium OttesenSCG-928-I14]|nr:LytTR family DNA-binding domain-containing protein [Bacteroidales bacterium OttesenSCG-928-I14]